MSTQQNDANGGTPLAEPTGSINILLDQIIDIIKHTPQKLKEYICHDELHSYWTMDYKTIRSKIETLLSNTRIDP